MQSRRGPGHDFEHDALLYEGEDEFVAGALPFVRQGLDAGEPTLVVLTPPRTRLLREALGADAAGVQFANMTEVGRNPARIIPVWDAFVGDHREPSRQVRGIGEPVWAGRSAAERVECQRHESLLNVAFAETPGFRLLCPYDVRALEPEVVEEARRSHPFLRSGDERLPSDAYGGTAALAGPFTAPLPPPSEPPLELGFQGHSLRPLREAVRARAAAAGLDEQRSYDLVLAASEVAANSVVHGGGRGVLRIWRDDGEVVCEIEDAGRNDQPLAGRVRPGQRSPSGRGLWIANQLCELVQMRTTPAGNVVRLHMRRG